MAYSSRLWPRLWQRPLWLLIFAARCSADAAVWLRPALSPRLASLAAISIGALGSASGDTELAAASEISAVHSTGSQRMRRRGSNPSARRRRGSSPTPAPKPSSRRRKGASPTPAPSSRRRKGASPTPAPSSRRRKGGSPTPTPAPAPAPSSRRRKGAARRRRRGAPAPPKFEGGPCPNPCEAKEAGNVACASSNVLDDVIANFGKKRLAQYGNGFSNATFLVASHQCHELYHCAKAYDETGHIEPELMPGGPFRSTKYESVKEGEQCRQTPDGGWGNLGECKSWQDCFYSCMDQNEKSATKQKKCDFLHYKAINGQCTSFTTAECQLPTRRRRRRGKPAKKTWDTVKAEEDFVVMRAYESDSLVSGDKDGNDGDDNFDFG